MPDISVLLQRGEELDLSGDFGRALVLIDQSRSSYFVTGKAGTGKSTLLRHFADNTSKQFALLAPTGLAAVNIGGETIHSFFGFPPTTITDEHVRFNSRRELYKALQVLVIDEVSMVRADLMDGIDRMLRLNRDCPSSPFGGVQLLLFGDIFQLEPVVASEEEAEYFSSYYRTPYFFSAKVFDTSPFSVIDLQKVFRQRDPAFIALLDAVRTNSITPTQLSALNARLTRTDPSSSPDGYITLTATNEQASTINRVKLRTLPQPELQYFARLEGAFTRKLMPADPILTLRPGAQVMFVKNDYQRRWVNGTIGVVEGVADSYVTVRVDYPEASVVYDVAQATWETRRYTYSRATQTISSEIVGSYTQIPLRLAWAITIHKSQGLTFDRTIVDFGRGAFANGQAYVALSRSTSLEGLVLRTRLRMADIKVSPAAIRFYRDRFLRLA